MGNEKLLPMCMAVRHSLQSNRKNITHKQKWKMKIGIVCNCMLMATINLLKFIGGDYMICITIYESTHARDSNHKCGVME